MRNFISSACVLCFGAAVAVSGCGRTDRDATKVPLGQTEGAGGAMMQPTITGEAKTALDSGNVLFRARDYAAALEQYRRSARLAPTEVTPLLGIMMVADVTSDRALAESTMQRMRELDPDAADSAAAMPHSEILQTHPRR